MTRADSAHAASADRARADDGGRPRSARPGAELAAGLLLGAALDAVIGDPRRGHPVALFGQLAARLER
nr:hypothetical protein [Micromonospora sp. DSM 115978]